MKRVEIPGVARWSAAGLLIVAALAGAAYWWNRASQARLEGKILKVRTFATGDESSMVVLDVRITNPARVLFQVKEVEVAAVTSGLDRAPGLVAAERDLDRVLTYYPLAGARYSPVLKFRERIRAGETVDRTIAASFAMPLGGLESRKRLEISIQDADGAVVTVGEERRRP